MISPGSTIGILGGGQLGRMSAMAAARMGYHVHIFCPEGDTPAVEVAARHTFASYDDEEALLNFAREVDVITFEFENIPHATAQKLSAIVPLRPGWEILHATQNRIREKSALQELGIPTAPWEAVMTEAELAKAAESLGVPAILKTAEQGYDGKGQRMVREANALAGAWAELGRVPCVLEGFVDFSMEMSVIVARRAGTDECAAYPAVQNIHRNHILHTTLAPAPISKKLQSKAQDMAIAIAQGMGLEGLLAVEMFVTGKDTLVVNELAPRPHNSGHWTLDAAATSQFEQHIRAVCGLPLSDPTPLCGADMINLLGDDIHAWREHLANPRAKLHLYGKRTAREGRKMGHVTVLK